MIRTILSLALVTSLAAVASLQAEPPSSKKTNKSKTMATVTPAAPLKSGWSLTNGVWVHSDGYKFVNNQVVRVGTQTHKAPPKPPTKAEIEAATKKSAPKTPAEISAAKAAERERNLAPRPAPQTGTHL
jgi:hypothetical protein